MFGCLRIVSNDYEKFLKDLRDMVAGTTIHTNHLQFLMTRVCQSLNHLNSEFMWKYFLTKSINTRSETLLDISTVYAVTYYVNSVHFRYDFD